MADQIAFFSRGPYIAAASGFKVVAQILQGGNPMFEVYVLPAGLGDLKVQTAAEQPKLMDVLQRLSIQLTVLGTIC